MAARDDRFPGLAGESSFRAEKPQTQNQGLRYAIILLSTSLEILPKPVVELPPRREPGYPIVHPPPL